MINDRFLAEIKSQIHSKKRKLSSAISQADKELSNKYHAIECSKYDACTGYKAYVELRDHLQKRRRLKSQASTYDKLLSILESSHD